MNHCHARCANTQKQTYVQVAAFYPLYFFLFFIFPCSQILGSPCVLYTCLVFAMFFYQRLVYNFFIQVCFPLLFSLLLDSLVSTKKKKSALKANHQKINV
ncbi:hypothetical protein K450DRAFT_250905 [Umbelopsis ramanniana AG]|uniref:Uncharacterized protein n=1 Tax=Umbelopsis ramanniana AG TaxID=1314678 RepID=A0AAD5HB03_UMBRA|nr:uncharacterized protein K450DRAFT_250905 [Umbelopsis ramanniana AG]KAI8577620.1 hypothetical protein K450DRAFT_250905 [Umbelopsis ramanniana AG]